jgi:GNAT superfamily N-acetyltransferase
MPVVGARTLCAPLHRPAARRAAGAAASAARPPSLQPWQLEVRRGFLPLEDAAAVASLLAEAFAASAGGAAGALGAAPPPPPASGVHKMRLVAALQARAAAQGALFTTVTAWGAPSPSGRRALLGVATAAPGLEQTVDSSAEAALGLARASGSRVAGLSNMAVTAAWRRRGLGRALLATAEAAVGAWPCPPEAIALAVYVTNTSARALYASAGYSPVDAWVDPRWREAAERGRLGPARRLLLARRVTAAP